MTTSVFITGASGYIGQALAIGFRHAGYRVYGLVRSAEKGATLVRHEVIPVVGTLSDASTYRQYVEKSSVIIDTVLDWSSGSDVFAVNRALLEAAAASSSPLHLKTFIYTSGILVQGPGSPDDPVIRDESFPLRNEFPFFKARIAFELEVLKQTSLRGVVIRPGFVYGGSGSVSGILFANGTAEKITIRGDPNRRWSWVHISDLVDGYIRAVRAGNLVKGEVFNLVGFSSPRYEDVVLGTARAAGFKGKIEYADPDPSDWSSVNANYTVVVNPQKAINLLGWYPLQLPLLDDIDVYYKAAAAYFRRT